MTPRKWMSDTFCAESKEVQHISIEEEYAQAYEPRYGKAGFMMLIPAPQNLITGEPGQSAIATVNIERLD